VRQAVLDVSRHEVFELGEAMLAGEAGRALRILAALRGEGEAAPRIVWVLAEELRTLAAVAAARAAGRPAEGVLREHRVYGGPRQAAVLRAADRVDRPRLLAAIRQAARCERSSKGVGGSDVWEELADLAVFVAGGGARPAARARSGR